jgi:PhzF family phenazine biosynthesis protein
MKLPISQVDSFTGTNCRGNPAGVCLLQEWLDDAVLQGIAKEMNLSDTAFVVPSGDGYHIRWFTPQVEVDLSGHATFASAGILLNEQGEQADPIRFVFRRGELRVRRASGGRLTLDFPSHPPSPCDVPRVFCSGV